MNSTGRGMEQDKALSNQKQTNKQGYNYRASSCHDIVALSQQLS